MRLRVEVEQEVDGRWIAEINALPGTAEIVMSLSVAAVNLPLATRTARAENAWLIDIGGSPPEGRTPTYQVPQVN